MNEHKTCLFCCWCCFRFSFFRFSFYYTKCSLLLLLLWSKFFHFLPLLSNCILLIGFLLWIIIYLFLDFFFSTIDLFLVIYCFFSIFSLIFYCLLVHFFYVFAILVVIRFFFGRSFAQLSFVDFFNSHICYESAIFLFPPFSLFLVIRFSMVKQQQQQQQLCTNCRQL